MRGATRLLLAVLALSSSALARQAPAASPQAGPKSILWSRTWDEALREASIRNVPIFILVSIGEG